MAREHLDAMQRAMMRGHTSFGVVERSAPVRVDGNAGAIIARLQAELQAERKARVAAEARLRNVLVDVARMTRPAPRPVSTISPATAHEITEPVATATVTSLADRIREIGGDEPEDDFDPEAA